MAWTSVRIPTGVKRPKADSRSITREQVHNPQDDHGKDVPTPAFSRGALKPGLPGTTKDYDGANMPWRC